MKPTSLALVIRRLHLYLAMVCLPWIVMYGITSLAFNHPAHFPDTPSLFDTSGENWTLEGSWIDVAIPIDGEPPATGARLLAVAGVETEVFDTFVDGERVEVILPSFWSVRRLTYHRDRQLLEYHTVSKHLRQILTDMHARSGYRSGSLLDSGWALMVDLAAIGFLIWVATGLYMWWQLPRMRLWGSLALGAGAISFFGILMLL